MVAPPERLDWIVFAEDWGGHPSTTQHLAAQLPQDDRILWIDSLGMRSPRLSREDGARIARRLRTMIGPSTPNRDAAPARAPDRVLRLPFLPWHGRGWCRALNRRVIGRAVITAARRLAMRRPLVLTANPISAHYRDALPTGPVIYLRLDDYASLPGVDARLIAASEPGLIAHADLVVAPNAALMPSHARRTLLLPQGVDVHRFATVPLHPPDTRVIGYWGMIDEWLDVDLVTEVARSMPNWTFELRGPARREIADRLRGLSNVRVLDPVPHHRLAAAGARWRGAWAPYRSDLQLPKASPLKLREYLAAGLPTASSPIPEAHALAHVTIVADLQAAEAWIHGEVAADSAERRSARRASQADAGWAGRADTLRRAARSLFAFTGDRQRRSR